MPRYFFDIDDSEKSTDLEGTELPDIAAAHSEAVRLAGGIIADHAEAFWGGKPWKFTVRDEAGGRFQLNFSAICEA